MRSRFKSDFPNYGVMALCVSDPRQDRDIYSGHIWGAGEFLSKVKNGKEFEGGLEKRKGKGGKRRKRMIKHTFMKLK